MSLARIVTRSAMVEALKGRTIVGDNVLDSEIGAIDVGADGSAHSRKDNPFVAVYTDDSEATIEANEVRSLVSNGLVDLVFEYGITSTMTVSADDGSGQITEVGILATDANFQFTLDVIARQIVDVLSDPANPWAEIARRMSVRYSKHVRKNAMNDDDGVRLAAQQMRITAELIDDPVLGCPLEAGSVYADYLDLLDASPNPDHQTRSTFLKGLFVPGGEDWALAQRRLGLTAEELLALGLGPLADDADRETPPVVQAILDADQRLDVVVTGE